MRIPALLSIPLVLACAGATPTHTQYLLGSGSEAQSGRVDAPAQVGLGRVWVAPYLDQAGIVIETEPGQVRAARYHQWAQPLQAGLRATLRAEISAALGYEVSAARSDGAAWDYTVDVQVDRLHGTMGGAAVMDASYFIARPGKDAVEYRFRESSTLSREGYPGVVDAEAALAAGLARSIAAALQELAGS